MEPHGYLSEVFKIVEGALRLDTIKVRNYATLLADKLETGGDVGSARRLRRLIEEQGNQLRPANLAQQPTVPVDGESRFTLLERLTRNPADLGTVMTPAQDRTANDFVTAVQHRDALENAGVRSAPSLLLYGPSGCGKTHLATELGERLKLPVYVARLDGLISSFLGNTAKNVRAIFEFAARTPCVLFLDEFDALAKIRDDQQELGELKRVVNSFIQTLDMFSSELVVVAATNHEKLLDSAIWRRFAFQLHIGLPDLKGRMRMWRHFAAGLPFTDRDFDLLAKISDGFSGAAIRAACDRLKVRSIANKEPANLSRAARLLAEQNVTSDHWLQTALLDDPVELYFTLIKEKEGAYSISSVSALTGQPKSTIARHLKVVARPSRVKHARRAPVHQSRPTPART